MCHHFDVQVEPHSLSHRLLRNFSIGFAGTSSMLVLSFLLVPVLTKNLSVEDYGRIIIVGNFFQFTGIFIKVRVNDLIYRFLPTFESKDDAQAASALLRLSLLICVATSGATFILAGAGSQWIAETVYRDPSLHLLLVIQMTSGALLPFEEYSRGILRIRDRFSSLILPQVLGTAFSLMAASVVIYGFKVHSLPAVVAALVSGQLFGIVVPLMNSLRLSWAELRAPIPIGITGTLADSRSDIWSTVVQTNLLNYLKVGAQDGGIFLLGVLASPEQVAFYGMATKLARPLVVLQNNLQAALNPEIVKLYGRERFSELSSLVIRIVKSTIVVGGIVAVIGFILAKPVLLLLTTRTFLHAIPVFRLTLVTAYITSVSMPFFYLSLCLGQLHRRNLAVSIRFVYIGIFCVTGLSAFNLALAQLMGALTTRLVNDLPVMRRLTVLANQDQKQSLRKNAT
jgi:O-antigen/teichoic acid export membrane protein